MTIDPKCQNSQGETLALASLPFYGDCEANMRLNMTTQPTISSARANQCRLSFGLSRPYSSLPAPLRSQIVFDDDSGLAVWRTEGDGHEPPPYWADEKGRIHNL